MNRIAEFCGDVVQPHGETFILQEDKYSRWRVFEPSENWHDCMLVEERVREKGLDGEYLDALYEICGGPEDQKEAVTLEMYWATKQQRMEAVLKVLDNLK
jgi:hypothetical protein